MKTATFISEQVSPSGAVQKLYKLSEPMTHRRYDEDGDIQADYVIVSAVNAMFTGPETYIFHADKDGEVLHWDELDGSFRGSMDHEQALCNAGYAVATQVITVPRT